MILPYFINLLNMKNKFNIDWLNFFYTALRIAIGWHFLYEGFSKVFIENWSSFSYLANSTGPLSGFYHSMASSEVTMKIVDILNIYGLILIGTALFIGWFTRLAALFGTFLLILYYFAYPPFGDSLFSVGEGHIFIVDKIFTEAIALMFIVFNKEKGIGIDGFIELLKKRKENSKPFSEKDESFSGSRREALKNIATIPFLGLMGFWAAQSNRKYNVDGKIGDHEISRLVLGGNLIGGWAHSRDLIYVPSLFKAYNTEKKIYETLILAEKAGINTINIGHPTNALIAKYKRMTGSKIKVISQVAPNMEKGDYFEQINQAIGYGADILQVQGNWCDWLVRDQKTEVIEAMLEKIRNNKITAGLASHTIDSLIICEEKGIIPDYYMKTMHHDKYWSAHPRENRVPFEVDGKKSLDHNKFHDNIFCLFPDRTAEFVNRSKVPVMGFKVLAAGAIEPKDGFNWAFENGADFICVGMFDFQIINDVNICIDTLNNLKNRKRQLYG